MNTSEDVARWLAAGQFGLWRQTARLNDVIRQAGRHGDGLGEAVGRGIEEERFPHRELSVAARRGGWVKGELFSGVEVVVEDGTRDT